jgi:RNA polymerase primary sigma factor
MRDFKISIRYTDPSKNLARYFAEVTKEKMLSVQEEAELAKLAKEGDQEAKEKIIKSNLRFVISVAKSYASSKYPVEDIISEGNRGLIEAIDNFDPSQGFKFISYAVWHIRKNILSFLNTHSRTIRLPQNVISEMRRYQEAENFFIAEHSREPSVDEILRLIDEKGMKPFPSAVIETITNKPVQVSLDYDTDGEGEKAYSPINWISSEENTEDRIFKRDEQEAIRLIFSFLKPFEKEIAEMKFGLGESGVEKTFNEIGIHFGKSSEWARGTFRKIERKMRRIARLKGIKSSSM